MISPELAGWLVGLTGLLEPQECDLQFLEKSVLSDTGFPSPPHGAGVHSSAG